MWFQQLDMYQTLPQTRQISNISKVKLIQRWHRCWLTAKKYTLWMHQSKTILTLLLPCMTQVTPTFAPSRVWSMRTRSAPDSCCTTSCIMLCTPSQCKRVNPQNLLCHKIKSFTWTSHVQNKNNRYISYLLGDAQVLNNCPVNNRVINDAFFKNGLQC